MIGRTLRDRYHILKMLGQGGFGVTYLAKDYDLPGHPQCVVKHLKPKSSDPAVLDIARRLFDREAQVLYRLGKLNDRIPTLSAHFEENGEFYFVQDFIDGHDLTKELIPGKKLSESYVINLLQNILEVLAIIHQQNAIHRDIKPANLMRRQDGKIVLIDFGAVKEISALAINSQGQTSLTIMIGSPGYMPSEQANGKPKFSSDIYAVGMVGIQALTGQNPKTLPENQITGEVIWRDRVQVSLKFADVLDKMVRDHFSQRYQNADESLQAILDLSLNASIDNDSTIQAILDLSLNASIDNDSTISIVPEQDVHYNTSSTQKTVFFEIVTVNSTGQITNRHQGETKFFTENIGNGVTLDMIAIPGGSFLMGSPNTEAERSKDEEPQHNVNVAPFFMGKYEVTQEQWQAVMGDNPSRFKGNKLPVENVSWYDAVEFCKILCERTGKTYRLPSEAEWEYACRAGTSTPFYFGETITPDLVNYNGNETYGTAPKGLYRDKTTDVGGFPPNAFGLYDMHGNVWEWCADIWHDNYQDAPQDGRVWDEKNIYDSYKKNCGRNMLINIKNDNIVGSWLLLRGGSWVNNPENCRAAYRLYISPTYRNDNLGFRVVCTAAWTS